MRDLIPMSFSSPVIIQRSEIDGGPTIYRKDHVMKKFATVALMTGIAFALTSSMAMAGGKNYGPKKKPRKDNSYYSYAVKFVCGTNPGFVLYDNGDYGRGGSSDRIVPGTYATAINIFNPNGHGVDIRAKLALTFPGQEGKAEPISKYLPSHYATALDCNEIPDAFLDYDTVAPYYKGFVVIHSKNRIDVTAVYTAGPVQMDIFCKAPYDWEEYCSKDDKGNYINGGKDYFINGLENSEPSVDIEQYTGRKIVNGKVADVLGD